MECLGRDPFLYSRLQHGILRFRQELMSAIFVAAACVCYMSYSLNSFKGLFRRLKKGV